jgi:NADPH-ferrihemoprotein reductase
MSETNSVPQGKDVVVFWGSQSGNSARLAKQLARELQAVHGIAATAEDLAMYDPATIESIPSSAAVGFIVSTFGEGDPPDSAADLDEWLCGWRLRSEEGGERSLAGLRYFAFGLGSTKYQHYNRFVDVLGTSLSAAGARRLGKLGKQDESLRSDGCWVEWKGDITRELLACVPRRAAAHLKSMHEADIDVADVPDARSAGRVLAEQEVLLSSSGASAVYAAPVSAARVLSATSDTRQGSARTYLHLEFDISGTGAQFAYSTGDHVALWPPNTDQEVRRLARLFGWGTEKLGCAVSLRPSSGLTDSSGLPMGSLTTRGALLRYYLDIQGLVSRELGGLLEHFAPTAEAQTRARELLSDPDAWNARVVVNHLTLGKLMQLVEPREDVLWPAELFALLVQTMPRLQPRYFSIASSPAVSGRRLAITVGVIVQDLPDGGRFHGLATNFLHGLQQEEEQRGSRRAPQRSARTAVLHIRRSSFKLPAEHSRPVVMIAAGSGVAPFLAFAQEREVLYRAGQTVGRTVLFFGCRAREQDYLYAEEWASLGQHGFFDVYAAFSRGGPHKQYVQHLVKQRAQEVRNLILEDAAACYICGSVKMAMDVKQALIAVLAEGTGGVAEARDRLDWMKSTQLLREDVWA